MADFQPFRALRFNSAIAGDPSTLISPPYDVVSDADRTALYGRSAYNISHVDFGPELPGDDEAANRYSRARDELRRWRDAGAVAEDAEPQLYVYDQAFTVEGTRYERRAVFGRLRLEPWDSGIILPHEHTGAAAKADRYRLLESTRVNLSPVLAMHRPIQGASFADSELGPPLLEAEIAGDRHTLRAVTRESAARFSAALADQRLYIADGHHRYETALAYRDECHAGASSWTGDEPENFVLATLVDISDPGLVVLPTHRLLKHQPRKDALAALTKLLDWGDLWPLDSASVEQLERDLVAAGRTQTAFGAAGVAPRRLSILKATNRDAIDALMPQDRAEPWRRLDVSILDHVVYPTIGYEPAPETIDYTESAAHAVEMVRSGLYDLAFLLNATPVEQVLACADAGERMPRKSTYFYPKLATGVVMYAFD